MTTYYVNKGNGIEDRRKKLVERWVSKMSLPRDQGHIQRIRDMIMQEDGEIYYIDKENGDNRNDGLTPETAWEDRGALGPDVTKVGDIFVDGLKVFVRRE